MKLYHFCRVSDLDSIAEKGYARTFLTSRSWRWACLLFG
jgi:hypothetical protein